MVSGHLQLLEAECADRPGSVEILEGARCASTIRSTRLGRTTFTHALEPSAGTRSTARRPGREPIISGPPSTAMPSLLSSTPSAPPNAAGARAGRCGSAGCVQTRATPWSTSPVSAGTGKPEVST